MYSFFFFNSFQSFFHYPGGRWALATWHVRIVTEWWIYSKKFWWVPIILDHENSSASLDCETVCFCSALFVQCCKCNCLEVLNYCIKCRERFAISKVLLTSQLCFQRGYPGLGSAMYLLFRFFLPFLFIFDQPLVSTTTISIKRKKVVSKATNIRRYPFLFSLWRCEKLIFLLPQIPFFVRFGCTIHLKINCCWKSDYHHVTVWLCNKLVSSIEVLAQVLNK